MKINKFIKFALIQLSIIILFVLPFYSNKPINARDCTTLQIVVEDKELALTSSVKHATYEFKIYSNGVVYEFPAEGIWGEYTPREMYEKINIGDTLEISYTKAQRFDGEYNYVVDARNDSDTYLDFDSFISRGQTAKVTWLIIFAVFEVLFLLVSFPLLFW